MAALGLDGPVAIDTGRPSRRAASAAQAAFAAAQAYEAQRGMDPGMPQPQPAEQSAAMRAMEAAAHGQALQHAQPAAGQEAQQADGAADLSDAAAEENGRAPAKKRKRVDKAGPASAWLTDEGSAGGAPASPATSAGGGAGTSTPAVPPAPAKPVDMEPLIELARQCGSQEELRQRLQERYPPSVRGAAGVGCCGAGCQLARWFLTRGAAGSPRPKSCTIPRTAPTVWCSAGARPPTARSETFLRPCAPAKCSTCAACLRHRLPVFHAAACQRILLCSACCACSFARLCKLQLPRKGASCCTAACRMLRPCRPSPTPPPLCRAGRVCCRTCRTGCSSWQASLWARRPRPTSPGAPGALRALREARGWMLMLLQPPSQRQQQRRRRWRQMAAAHRLRSQPGRLPTLRHNLWRAPARLWGLQLRQPPVQQPQRRAPQCRLGLWAQHRRWPLCKQSERRLLLFPCWLGCLLL